jgi:hypothetical protein
MQFVSGTLVSRPGTLVVLARRRCRNRITGRDTLEPLRGRGSPRLQCLSILGFLGIVVPSIRDLAKMGKWEKAVWTFVMFALMWLEVRSIYLDRSAHDVEQAAARAKQLQHFNEVGEGIKGAVAGQVFAVWSTNASSVTVR